MCYLWPVIEGIFPAANANQSALNGKQPQVNSFPVLVSFATDMVKPH